MELPRSSAKAVPVACRPSQPKRETTPSSPRLSSAATAPAYLRASAEYLSRSCSPFAPSAASVVFFLRAILRLELLVLGNEHRLPGRVLEKDYRAKARASIHDRDGNEGGGPRAAAGELVPDLLVAVGEVLRERLAHLVERLLRDGGDGK